MLYSLDSAKSDVLLPQMFDILATNMSKITPTNNSYEDDKRIWLSYMTPARIEDCRILLMYVGEVLAGYFQYHIDKR